MQNEQFEVSFSKSLGNDLLNRSSAILQARRHGEEFPGVASPKLQPRRFPKPLR
jgi:hypothetical protein